MEIYFLEISIKHKIRLSTTLLWVKLSYFFKIIIKTFLNEKAIFVQYFYGRCSIARIAITWKNWSTQKYNCSTPFEQMSKKTGRKSKIICRTCIENCLQAVSLLDKIIMTAQIATGQQKFWKMSTARHNL